MCVPTLPCQIFTCSTTHSFIHIRSKNFDKTQSNVAEIKQSRERNSKIVKNCVTNIRLYTAYEQ